MSIHNPRGAVAKTITHFGGLLWRLILMKAQGDANEAHQEYERGFLARCCGCGKYNKRNFKQKKLKNIWDKLGKSPLMIYMDYKTEPKLASKWRYYQINELEQRDIFRTMDRLKIVSGIVTSCVNIYKLSEAKYGFLEGFTPLHNIYELYMTKKRPLFESLPEIYESMSSTKSLESFFNYMKTISDEAEGRDFITSSVTQDLKFSICHPSKIDIPTIQNYFGEKVALYFTFLKYTIESMKISAYLGVIIFITDTIFLTKAYADISGQEQVEGELGKGSKYMEDYHYVRLGFTFWIVIWSSLFLGYWKREQKLFAITYGMSDMEQIEKTRPGFKGSYVRDIGSAENNIKYYPKLYRSLKQILSLGISILLILLSVFFTLLILSFKAYLHRTKPNAFYTPILPALLNLIVAKIFSTIYMKISLALNFYENHQKINQFENSIIFKIFLFNLLNQFNPFFIIGFLKDRTTLLGECIPGPPNVAVRDVHGELIECYDNLANYIFSFYISSFFLNFLEILVPYFMKKFVGKKLLIKRDYSWGLVDRQIEEEWYNREPYQVTPEVDGVLNEYLEIVLMYCFLSFFGPVFPLGFFTIYLTLISEINIDKVKLLELTRRPIPVSTATIGSWQNILKAISYVSIFINMALLVFSAKSFDILAIKWVHIENFDFDEDVRANFRSSQFAIWSCVLLAIKFMIDRSIPDIPGELKDFLKRQEKLLDTLHIRSSGARAFLRTGLNVNGWKKDLLTYVCDPTLLIDAEKEEDDDEKVEDEFSHLKNKKSAKKKRKGPKPGAGGKQFRLGMTKKPEQLEEADEDEDQDDGDENIEEEEVSQNKL